MDLREMELGGHKPGEFHRVGELILDVYTEIALRKMSAKEKADWDITIQELVNIGAAAGRYCLCQKCGLPAYIFENKGRIFSAGYDWYGRCGEYK